MLCICFGGIMHIYFTVHLPWQWNTMDTVSCRFHTAFDAAIDQQWSMKSVQNHFQWSWRFESPHQNRSRGQKWKKLKKSTYWASPCHQSADSTHAHMLCLIPLVHPHDTVSSLKLLRPATYVSGATFHYCTCILTFPVGWHSPSHPSVTHTHTRM